MAYPRWRGEHLKCGEGLVPNGGLPPLARGALQMAMPPAFALRPTPAGAGSTVAGR